MPAQEGRRHVPRISGLINPVKSFLVYICEMGVIERRAQRSLQMLAGESPVMVKPENHVAYTQCWK